MEKNTTIKASQRFFAFEHTGLYSMPLSMFLSTKNISYSLIPGLELKKSLGLVRGKNDKVDAKLISLYAYRRKEELEAYTLPSKSLFELRKLLSLRDKLVKQKAGYKATNKEINGFLTKKEHVVYFEVHAEMIKILNEKIKKVEKEIRRIFRYDAELEKQHKLITSIIGVGGSNCLAHDCLYECIYLVQEFQKICLVCRHSTFSL